MLPVTRTSTLLGGCLLLLVCLLNSAHAALTISSTRIIYESTQRSASVVIANPSQRPFAAQTWVNTQADDTSSLTLSQQDYWQRRDSQRQFQLNFSTSHNGVSYSLYPGNAEKFVCDLHTKTVTPAAGHPGDAPTVVTTYRYKTIKVLASSSEATRQENWCGLASETLTNGGSTLKVTAYDYYEQEGESPVPEKPLQHGRLKKRVVGFPNPAGDEPDQPPMLQTAVEYAYQFETLEWGHMRDERLHDLPSVDVFKTVLTTVGHDKPWHRPFAMTPSSTAVRRSTITL